MFTGIKKLAPFVKNQFPAFYAEEGDNFLQFVKAYYEWMDEQSSTYKSRRLGEYRDIDSTLDQYVTHFIQKYMYNIPDDILGNKRLLQKHILELYRSKGSTEGLKLLFRLIYNDDIELYFPADDILKTSDGIWQQKEFIEVEENKYNELYKDTYISGTSSGAVAYVSEVEKYYLPSKTVNIMHLTNVTEGTTNLKFKIKEQVKTTANVNLKFAPFIVGSPSSVTVDGSDEGFAVGDILVLDPDQTDSKGVKIKVDSVIDPTFARGFIAYKIVDGGYGYTANSVVTVARNSATLGTGASFKVGELSNTVSFEYNTNLIFPEKDLLLNATSWSANLNSGNTATIINDILDYQYVTIGKIETIIKKTSGDRKYNGTVSVSVVENKVKGYGYGYSEYDQPWGNNAIITGKLATGNGLIETASIYASGLGFNTNAVSVNVYLESNTEKTAAMTIITGALGKEEGAWKNNRGFLNSDKYIQDSDYYQDFSYEIQFTKSLNKYVDMLKQVMHPVGNRVFGRSIVYEVKDSNLTAITETVSQT